MISLTIQFKLIIFSFIFGFLFSAFLDWFNSKIFKYKNYIKIILSIFTILLIAYIYFLGLQSIGYAIFHIYAILSVIFGYVLYDVIINLIANNNKK